RVAVGDRSFLAHPVDRGAGVETARKRDADAFTGRKRLENVSHVRLQLERFDRLRRQWNGKLPSSQVSRRISRADDHEQEVAERLFRGERERVSAGVLELDPFRPPAASRGY